MMDYDACVTVIILYTEHQESLDKASPPDIATYWTAIHQDKTGCQSRYSTSPGVIHA